MLTAERQRLTTNIGTKRAGRYLIACVLILSAAATAGAKADADSHARVSLLAEENSFTAGHPAWIGLFFDIEKEWHIYWVNPGDSGAALRVHWSVPSGFKAGEIRWPVPSRVGKGELTDYGYEGHELLPLELKVPANYLPGTRVKIVAAVQYLICRKLVCIVAHAQPTLSLPSADGIAVDAAAKRKLFQETQESEPKSLPSTWKARAFDDGRNFVLTLESGSPITKASFFPLVSNQLDNAAPQTITPTPRGVQITLKKSAQLALRPRPIPVLKGVVVLAPYQAYEIAAPLAVQ
jgi:DsbC/DsbD-like thiol-disulfide interchange protein